MKTVIFGISVMFSISNVLSQGSCINSVKVVTPSVLKPAEGVTVLATCTTFEMQWQESLGSAGQAYIASIMFQSLLNSTQIDTLSSPVLWGTLKATFPVKAGMIVSWNIQGIKTIDSRTFYSYPLRSSEEHTIPDCVNPSIAAAESTASSISNNLPAIEEEKVKVDLYPNPVHNVLNLNISSMVKTATANNGTIRVVGIDGKTVLTQKAAFGSVQVNVSRLINGAYFIRVEDAGGKLLYIAKFVKE